MFVSALLLLLLSVNIRSVEIHDINWTLRNANGSITVPAVVPGGVYSDLSNSRVIGDILHYFNDVLTRWVAHDTWTYEGRFNVTYEQLKSDMATLVFEGLDTVAFIELNDRPVGSTDNMFVRYVYDVKQYLQVGENILNVTFVSPIDAAKSRSDKSFTAPSCVPPEYNGECHANQLRKMQASFGWDWGPAFPSVGIWKPAYIQIYDSAIMRSVTVQSEKINDIWKLTIKVYLETNPQRRKIKGQIHADLTVDIGVLSFAHDIDLTVSESGTAEIEVTDTISNNVIRLWWPNGYGDQPLYDLKVYIYTDLGIINYKTIKIGFRTVELIEENAANKLGNDTTGSSGLTFYFKINGYPLFMKGSNWIPAHILPESSGEKKRVDELLWAAKEAHMSMLRVWGGGLYESDYFYEQCDQLGILIWQDFLFACSMYPVDYEFISSVQTEVEQNVKRLQYHASIALWAGNNENEVALIGNWYGTKPNYKTYAFEYVKLYVHTIKPIVEYLDPGRRYLVSSPTNGRQSEKEGYIAKNPYDPHYGDTHYYNYLADNWDMNIYPKTRFASEYGFQSMPSWSTFTSTAQGVEDYSIDSAYSKHRQHSPNGYEFIESQMDRHFNYKKEDFRMYMFYSQISQAMAMKAETEFYRQSQEDWYTMGALYWQLNDVWQAPSWSGIEYGGKWKMLHYYAKSFFAPVLVSPRLLSSNDVDVYILNDRFVPIIEGTINVDVFNLSSLVPMQSLSFDASAKALSSTKQTFQIPVWQMDPNIFLKFSLEAKGVMSSPTNYLFPKPVKDMQGLIQPEIKLNVTQIASKRGRYLYGVHVQVNTVVPFLFFESSLSGGHFDDNGFIVTVPSFTVKFTYFKNLSVQDVLESITYTYYTG